VPVGLNPPVNVARSEAEPPIVMLAGETVELMVGLAMVTVRVNGVVDTDAE
jgi:hypothetical protein